jgi:hypothetical protein
MAAQTNTLRSRQNKVKPLYIRRLRYLAIDKLVERENPNIVPTTEVYYPYKGEGDSTSFRDSLRRQAYRHVIINVNTPVTHEIHLADSTVKASIDLNAVFEIPIAATFSIYGSTRTLLKNRRSGIGAYLHGEGENEVLYYILAWDDVMDNPLKEKDYKGHEQTVRKLERSRYPTEGFGRIENGKKVHYLQKADPEEYTAVHLALKVFQGHAHGYN